jgi:two-component system OmpR family response regulator
MYTDRKFKIVLIDDDPTMTEMLKDFIEKNYKAADITFFHSGEEALTSIYSAPEVIVLDYHLDSINPSALNGLQILKKLKDMYPEVPVIFLSGEEKSEIAVNTIKYGAYDYIVKNENAFHRLEIILTNIFTHGELKKNLGSQKFFNRLLGILLIAVIIGLIIVKMSG